jgi:predicted MPP superfamily phosphohydrolase
MKSVMALPLIGFLLIELISTESFAIVIQGSQATPFGVQNMLPDLSIATLGDMGCKPVTSNLIKAINNKMPRLILALGDLSYQRYNPDCWLNIVSPIQSKMKIVLGDHDYASLSLLKQYRSLFNLSQEYYSFNIQNVHFLALATEIPFDANSSQYNFVKKDLESATNNSEIKWIIVFSYRPQYSSLTEHPGNAILRETYHPLFEKYHVDIVLQAHNHNYQRSYPINYNPDASQNPLIADNDSKFYQDPDGQIYVTVGTGGAIQYGFSAKSQFVATQYEGFGFLNISITNNGRNLTGTFYTYPNSLVKDRFTIIK